MGRAHPEWRTIARSALAGLAFNAAMAAMPVAAAGLATTILEEQAYAHHVSDATLRATRARVEAATAALIRDGGGDRTLAWSGAVSRELVDGDVAAAQGILLSASAALPAPLASRLQAQIPPKADDLAIAAAAASFLSPDVAAHYRAAAEGYGGRAATPMVLGDTRDLAAQARAWVAGDPVDRTAFLLAGIAMSLPQSEPVAATARTRMQSGAAVLRAAKRAAALSPAFLAELEARLAVAARSETLEPALAEAVAAEVAGADLAAGVLAAFRRSLSIPEALALGHELEAIGAIAEATSPATLVRLMPLASSAGDLPALRLLTLAAGDRAAPLVKYGADPAGTLALAKPTLAFTPAVRREAWLLALLSALALGVMAVSVLQTVSDRGSASPRRDARRPRAPAAESPRPTTPAPQRVSGR